MFWRICLALSIPVGVLLNDYLIYDALSGPSYQSALTEGWPLPADQFVAATIFLSMIGGLGLVFLATMGGLSLDNWLTARKARRADCEAAVRRALIESV